MEFEAYLTNISKTPIQTALSRKHLLVSAEFTTLTGNIFEFSEYSKLNSDFDFLNDKPFSKRTVYLDFEPFEDSQKLNFANWKRENNFVAIYFSAPEKGLKISIDLNCRNNFLFFKDKFNSHGYIYFKIE